MHGLGNNGKEEDGRYIYAMFKELLPLAHNLSSTHTKVASNILKEFGIQKKRGKILLGRITNHSNRSRHVQYKVCTWKAKLIHHS